jgi:hypothetical protein
MASWATKGKLLASKNNSTAAPFGAFRHKQLLIVLPTSVRTGFFTALLRVVLRSITLLHSRDFWP